MSVPFSERNEALSVEKEVWPCLETVPLATAVFRQDRRDPAPGDVRLAMPGDGSGFRGEGEGVAECYCPPVGRGQTQLNVPQCPGRPPGAESSSPRLADFWVAQFSEKDVTAVSYLISKAPVP